MAVKVTDCPEVEGSTDEDNAVVVAAVFTVSVRFPELLA